MLSEIKTCSFEPAILIRSVSAIAPPLAGYGDHTHLLFLDLIKLELNSPRHGSEESWITLAWKQS
jgi:hypothetical protein